MRTVRGLIVLPPDAPRQTCGRLVVELRDVSQLDAPSEVVAQQQFESVSLEPNGQVPFQFEAPEVEPGRMLSLRVHASLDGSGQVTPGDLLSTASCPISASGAQSEVAVPVKRI